MITKQDLLEAIAECQGVRSPNANTAIKLAAFYTILDHLDEKEQPAETSVDSIPQYSFSMGDSGTVHIESESEFAKVIEGRSQSEIWPVMDELMGIVKLMNEKLYNGVIRKLSR